MKKLFLAAAMAASVLALGACTQTAQPPAQKPVVSAPQPQYVADVPPQTAPAPKPPAIEHNALMKSTGKTVNPKEFVECMDPATKPGSCGFGFDPRVTWSYYAGLIERRFGVKLADFGSFKAFMLSADVSVVPCTADIVRAHRMGRIHIASGAITEDYKRTNCYNPEGFFAYKGQPFVSTACGNGVVPEAPPEKAPKPVPVCDKDCKKP